MKYHVAVRDHETTAEFSFESESERDQFITKTKEERPNAEFVSSEVDDEINNSAFFYPNRLSA
ncbi:MAG: hypothetical protein NXH75_06700 [Halobacteriovoraceae bacterium]|nr:hypothetical protein [Halobacteriovoraceae bacterium]